MWIEAEPKELFSAVDAFILSGKDRAIPQTAAVNLFNVNGKLIAEMYIRHTWRFIEGEQVRAICIARVEVADDYKNTGMFTFIRTTFEALADKHNYCAYIESVVSPILFDACNRLIQRDSRWTVQDFDFVRSAGVACPN